MAVSEKDQLTIKDLNLKSSVYYPLLSELISQVGEK